MLSRSHGLGLCAWVTSTLATAGVSVFQSAEGTEAQKGEKWDLIEKSFFSISFLVRAEGLLFYLIHDLF